MAEDILSFALSGVYSLLILSLTFNFLLAIRLHLIDKKVEDIDRCSREEIVIMEDRLKKIKEEILHRKGLV